MRKILCCLLFGFLVCIISASCLAEEKELLAGVYKVGVDIEAGSYTMSVPEESFYEDRQIREYDGCVLILFNNYESFFEYDAKNRTPYPHEIRCRVGGEAHFYVEDGMIIDAHMYSIDRCYITKE